MSAEVETMFSVKEVPWHGLGRVLPTAPKTTEEALILGGLDWEVARLPTTCELDGVTLNTGHNAIVRKTDKRVLGNVGSNYYPIQNAKAFAFFNKALEKNLVTIETAGSLRGGRHVWMLARIIDTAADIVPGDRVDAYALVSNSHDGSLRTRLGFCGTRVVCQNTLSLAHGEGRLIRVSHTKNAEVALENLEEIIDFQRKKFSATVEQMRSLAKLGVSTESLRSYVERVFLPEVKKRTVSDEDAQTAIKGIHGKIIPLFEKGRGNDLPGVKGTMWAAYNAVSEFMTWEKGRTKDKRLESLWFGEGGKINRRALQMAQAA